MTMFNILHIFLNKKETFYRYICHYFISNVVICKLWNIDIGINTHTYMSINNDTNTDTPQKENDADKPIHI